DHGHHSYDTQFRDALHRRTELPLAAIDDHQLRQALAFVQQPFVSAVHDLLHRREVVDALHRLYIVVAVIFFALHPIAETHHRRHGIAALEIGVIETFDVHRQFGEL